MKTPLYSDLFRLLGALIAGFLPWVAVAQSSVIYTPTFKASDINMWGSGVATANAKYFYGAEWNVSGSVGSIAETPIGDFGGRVFGSSSGKVGIDVKLAATAGHVDINLPYRVTISSATNLSNAGTHTLNLSTVLASLPTGDSYVSSTFASAGFEVRAQVQATATVGGKIAFFDSFEGSIPLPAINLDVPITSMNANQLLTFGVPVISGTNGVTLPLPPPLSGANAPKLATPGELTLAPLSLNANSGAGLSTTVSQPNILGINADLLALASWAAGLPINPFDVSLNLGPIGFTKRDLSANVGVDLGLSQDISLNPKLGVILRSSIDLTYNTPGGVVTTNALVVTDLSQPITFNKPAGEVAIFPEFFLTPTLRNNTDLILTGTFSLDAATYGYSFFDKSGTLGPLFTFDSSISTNIGLVDSTFNVSGTGLNISQVGRSLTNVVPTVGNVTANQSVEIPGLVGSFNTSSIAAGGRLFLSAGSLYLNTTTLTVAAASGDTTAGALELASGSGASANRLDTPRLNNLGTIKVGAGSTLNVTALNGFENVNGAGLLTGGTFIIDGAFNYVGPSLTTNAANLTLGSTGLLQNATTLGGNIGNALTTLAANSGTLTLKTPLNTGRAFNNSGTLDLFNQLTTTTFANTGLLSVQGGGKLVVTSPNGFTGVNSSGVLSGNYYLTGQIAYQGAVNPTFPVLPGDTPVYYAGHTITTNSGNLTLAGPSIDPRISNQQPDGGLALDALATLSNNTGNLILNTGATQRLNQGLTNNGGIGIFDLGTKLSVGGQFTNAAGKTLTIRRGTLEVFNSSFDYNFTNLGILNLEQGGRIEVDGSLGNFSNVNLDNRTGTLTGGTWNVGGTIAYGTGSAGAPNIREIGTGTVINMLGGDFYNQFFNQSALSYLAINRGTLNLGSSYVLKSNAGLTNTGSITLSGSSGWLGFADTLANSGTITINAGSTLSSLGNKTFADAANWINVNASGLLSGIGQLVLAGTLDYKGIAITGLASGSDLTLSGDSWSFFRRTGSNTGTSGFGLTTLGGTLRLANRAKFETPVGATFTVQSTGTLTTSADSAFVVRQGLLQVAGGANVTNNGVILLQHSGASPASFSATGNVTLSGTGSLQLTNFAGNALADGGGTLTNSATHLIAGAGSVTTKLVNRGTIESIGSAGLYFQNASPSGLVNSGIIRAGSSLIYPVVGNTFDFSQPTVVASPLTIYATTVTNSEGATAGRLIASTQMWIGVSTVSGGRVEIPSGGWLTLDNATLTGGIFDLQTGGRVEIYGGRTILNGSSLSSAIGSTLTLLDVGNAGDPAILEIAGSQPFLNFGTLVMRNNSRLEGAAQFINRGTVRVDQPAVTTVPVINSNFRNASDGVVNIDKSSSLRWVGDAFNAGRVNLGPSGDNSAGIAGTLSFPSNSTLFGGGEIRLGALVEQIVGGVTSQVWSASGRITSPIGTAPTLTNADNTLSGAGTIGDTRLGLVNQVGGTVRALGGTLLINPGSGGVTNQGLFAANANARLEINTTNGPFTNYSTTTNTLTGGRYDSAGTLAFSGADIRINAADLALTGSGQYLNATTNANALANFTTNAAGATFRLQSGATFASSGAFTNQGTLVVGGTDTLAGGTLTTPSLTGSGTVNLADATAQLTFNAASGTLTASNAVTGSGKLLKQGASTLTLSDNNSYTGGTTIAGGTLQIGAGGTTGAIVGDITNNAALAFNRSDALTFAGIISGTGSLTKSGTGSLTLSGANTHSGGTTISAGTLEIGAGGTTGSIGGNITNNAALSFNRSDALTYAGVISGTGSLTKLGAGTLTLSGANTYSGVTTISAGTLALGAADRLSNSTALTVASGATFNLAGFAETLGSLAGAGNVTLGAGSLTAGGNNTSTTFSGIISGTGSLTKSGTGSLTLSGANTHSGGTTISAGTLEIGAGGTTGSIGGNLTNNANLAFNRSDTLTYAGVISGTGSLSKLGAGTLTLSGANTHSGGTTISDGTLQVGAGGTTGSIGGNITNNANLAFNRSDALTYAGVISGTGSLSKLGTGTLTLSGANTYTGLTNISAGTLTLGAADRLSNSTALTVASGATFNLAGFAETLGSLAGAGNVTLGAGSLSAGGDNTSTTFSGVLSGTGSLTKLGTGTLTLSGANTYSGGSTISGGTLIANHNSAFGTGTVTLSTGNASLLVSGITNRTIANSIAVVAGATTAMIGTTGTGSFVTYSGNLSLNRSATLYDSTGSRTSFDGVISGNVGTLTIAGGANGRVTAAGINTFVGDVVINDGITFQLNSNGNQVLPLATKIDTSTSGRLWIAGPTTIGSLSGGASSIVQVANGGVPASTLSVGANDTSTTFAGIMQNGLSGSGALALTKLGAGTLTLTGANTYTGGTTISAGTLQIGSGSTTGSVAGNITNHAALSFNRADALTYAGVVSGTGSVTKLGAGILTLSGANTYTGNTAINLGTVRVANSSGSAFGSGAVTVASGATLAGAGSFTGPLSLAGTISPGTSPGILNTGSQTWAGGGAYVWEINNATGVAGTNWDLLSISGSLTINATSASPFAINLTSLTTGNAAGNVINFNSASNSSYTIATASGGISGFGADKFTLNTTGFSNSLNGGAWSISQAGNNLNLNFTASAIPEPGTYAALAGLVALGLAVWRRRSR